MSFIKIVIGRNIRMSYLYLALPIVILLPSLVKITYVNNPSWRINHALQGRQGFYGAELTHFSV